MRQQEASRELMKQGADVNINGGLLDTPIMAAAAYGRLCVVQDFVDASIERAAFEARNIVYGAPLTLRNTCLRSSVGCWWNVGQIGGLLREELGMIGIPYRGPINYIRI